MPQDLELVTSVVEAIWDEADVRGLSLANAPARIFTLMESGIRDFETLKAMALRGAPKSHLPVGGSD